MVNTFLPYPDFKRVALVLDTKRLMKQRVEAYQIIKAIECYKLNRKSKSFCKKSAWINHPATKMWMKNLNALKLYFNVMIDEINRRGYKNSLPKYKIGKNVKMPFWLGYEPIHLTHRASLLRKNYEHYSKYFKVPKRYMTFDYIWITKLSDEQQKHIKYYMEGKIKKNPYRLIDLSFQRFTGNYA